MRFIIAKPSVRSALSIAKVHYHVVKARNLTVMPHGSHIEAATLLQQGGFYPALRAQGHDPHLLGPRIRELLLDEFLLNPSIVCLDPS